LTALPKDDPAFVLAAKNTFTFPAVLSVQVTYTEFSDAASSGLPDDPPLLLRLFMLPNSMPELSLARRSISLLPEIESRHTT
jgi:hypothetical protein